MSKEEAKNLIIWWLNRARKTDALERLKDSLFPFSDEFLDILENRPEIMLPRPLVKMCFFIIAKAEKERIEPPIPVEFIKPIIDEMYPSDKRSGNE